MRIYSAYLCKSCNLTPGRYGLRLCKSMAYGCCMGENELRNFSYQNCRMNFSHDIRDQVHPGKVCCFFVISLFFFTRSLTERALIFRFCRMQIKPRQYLSRPIIGARREFFRFIVDPCSNVFPCRGGL